MNHREATIQAIRDLAQDCSRGGVYSGTEIARALHDIADMVERIPEPVKPDIRPASELTTERLEHWRGGWMVHYAGGSWVCAGRHALFPGLVTRRNRSYGFHDIEVRDLAESYPIRNGNPWEFASWDDVDAALKAKGEG